MRPQAVDVSPDPRAWRWPNIKRDTILFTFGLVGLAHEAYIHTGPTRHEWIMVFAGMCGLPLALYRDEKRQPPKGDGQ